jgi:hypothetical protein
LAQQLDGVDAVKLDQSLSKIEATAEGCARPGPASMGMFAHVQLNKDRTVKELSTMGVREQEMTPKRRIVPKSAGVARVHNLQ